MVIFFISDQGSFTPNNLNTILKMQHLDMKFGISLIVTSSVVSFLKFVYGGCFFFNIIFISFKWVCRLVTRRKTIHTSSYSVKGIHTSSGFPLLTCFYSHSYTSYAVSWSPRCRMHPWKTPTQPRLLASFSHALSQIPTKALVRDSNCYWERLF